MPNTIAASAAPLSPAVLEIVTLLTPLIGALGALVGVWLGGRMQRRQAEQIYEKQRRDRLQDETHANELLATASRKRQALAFYEIARALESYTKECATVGSDHDSDRSKLTPIPDLEFPKSIAWEEIDPARYSEIKDFEHIVPLVKSFAQGRVDHSSDLREAKDVNTEAAARLGRKAWSLAGALRRDAGLPPLQFARDGWNYAAFIHDEWNTDVDRSSDT